MNLASRNENTEVANRLGSPSTRKHVLDRLMCLPGLRIFQRTTEEILEHLGVLPGLIARTTNTPPEGCKQKP
jgi:hypothetical protein